MDRESRCASQASPCRTRIIVGGLLLILVVAQTAIAGDDCWPTKLTEDALIGAPEHPPEPLSVQLTYRFRDAWIDTARSEGKPPWADRESPKAAVLCIDWSKVRRVPFFGFIAQFERWFSAYGYPTLDIARQEALGDCDKWRTAESAACGCVVLMENDKVVLQPTDEALREYGEGFGSPYYFGWDRFQRARKRLVIADAEDGTLPSPRITPSDPVPARKPLPVVYPYTQVDYGAACWGLYTYILVDAGKPDGGQFQRLKDLAERGFYNCTSVQVDLPPSDKPGPRDPVERHCKLLKAVPISGPLEDTVAFPEDVTEGIENAGIASSVFHTAWVELTVRLATDNQPIDVFEGIRPVALVSNDRLLLGAEVQWPQPNWACAVGASLPKREVLHVAKCQGQDCVAKAMRSMAESVLHGMELDPIAARRFPNDGHPEEYQLRREVERSLVLGGAFFEKSRYLVKIWSSDDAMLPLVYMRSSHRGTNAGPRLFVNVTQILSVSANRLSERYSEATDSDVSKYEKALAKAVDASVARVCATLGGTVISGICEVDGGTK